MSPASTVRVASILLALLALVLVPARAAEEEDLRDVLDRAARHYQAGDYPAARDAYEKATELDLGSIRAWRGLGWSEWSLGRKDVAIRIWNDALQVKPHDPGLLLALAIAAESRGRASEALSRYGQVIDHDPGHVAARLGRARILTERKQYREAERDLRVVLDREPGQFEAQFAIAQIYRTTGRKKEAERAFERLVRHPPEPKYLRALADAMLELDEPERAIEFYRRNLRYNPGNRGTMLGLARAHATLHQYREAVATLGQFLDDHPDDAKIREELARFAYYGGEFETAVGQLEHLVEHHPEETKWRISLARALEQAGDQRAAEDIAEEILAREPDNADALGILYEHARASGDTVATIAALEKLIAVEPTANRWNDLGDFHLIRGETQKEAGATEDAAESYLRSVEAHQEAATLDPGNTDARLGIATALRLRGDHERAIEVAQDVIRQYPNVERARRELYESYASLGEYDRAVAHLRATMELFPRNPRLEHEYARIMFRSGERADAIEFAHSMVDTAIHRSVPILLYHGVSPASTRTDTMPLENFRDQMQTLADLGYQPITVHELAAFLEEGAALPEKPVLITFDDARVDSFRYADPVLDEVGFRATMFIPVHDVGRHGPFNAVWPQVRAMKASGRWDMQCHSYRGHHQIPIDPEGNTGLFLANRKWLESEKRVETTKEYRARLEKDYRKCAEALQEKVPGTNLLGYAYPFGEIGQKGFSNEPQSVSVNQTLAAQYFGYGFVQDSFGFATRRSAPATLPRFEVPRDFDGEQLVEHLRATDPAVSTRLLLADLYSWDGRFAEANAIFDRLAASEGVDRAEILARRGRVDLWRGDFAAARRALHEAAARDPEHRQALAGLESLQMRTRPQLEALGLLYDDNRGRTNLGLGPRGSLHLSDRLVLSTAYRYRTLADDGFETDDIDGFGTGDTSGVATDGDATIPPPDTVDLEVRGHEFEAQADYRWDWRTGIVVSGGVAQFRDESSSRFTDEPDPIPMGSVEGRFPLGAVADVRLGVERGYVGTAGAVIDETGETAGSGRLEVRPIEKIELVGDFRGTRYDGGNARRTATAQALREVWDVPLVRLGYQFRYDDADEEDPFFYTPDTYVGNDGVIKVQVEPAEQLELALTTTVGAGRERGGNAELQTSFLGEGSFRLAERFGLFLNGGRSQAADYKALSLNGGFYLTF